jgi:hypothetical protein
MYPMTLRLVDEAHENLRDEDDHGRQRRRLMIAAS